MLWPKPRGGGAKRPLHLGYTDERFYPSFSHLCVASLILDEASALILDEASARHQHYALWKEMSWSLLDLWFSYSLQKHGYRWPIFWVIVLAKSWMKAACE